MFKAFQTAVFKHVAEQIRSRFPHRSLELVYADKLILQDMETLRDSRKLRWDPSLKSDVFLDMIEQHPVKLVIYYRGQPIGYAFGCYCEKTTSMHICWMEKRNDAHNDFDHQMLGVVLESYASYARFLQKRGFDVKEIALISPIDGVRRYYTDCGFTFVSGYYGGADAMVLTDCMAQK